MMPSARNITPEQMLVLIETVQQHGEMMKSLYDVVAEQQQRLSGLDALTNMHTEQILTLTKMIGMLGFSLFSTGILSREAAEIIRDTVVGDIETPVGIGVRPLLDMMMDLWLRPSGDNS
jgi:hypothetical protein